MGVERLRLIGAECPAYAGNFAISQAATRAVMIRDIERESTCKKIATHADEMERALGKAQWWQEHGPGVAAIAAVLSFAAGVVGGFVVGERLR